LERVEVRIAGFGGQGVVLAGVLLGQAALNDGGYAVQTQSYGAEARGGAARSEVIVSDAPVVYPEVISPGILVSLSQAALDRYIPDLRPGGTLITDADLVSDIPGNLDARHTSGPFAETAGKALGKPIVANMVMLGFLMACTGVVSAESLGSAVSGGVPEGTEELNLRAVEQGARMARQMDADT